MKPFSEYLRELRKAKDMTQEELSRACSQTTLHASVVSRIESGQVRASFEQMQAMIDALGTSWSTVLRETDAAFSQNVATAADRPLSTTWQPRAVAATAVAIGNVQLAEGVILEHYTVLDATYGAIVVAPNVLIGHGAVIIAGPNQTTMVEESVAAGAKLP